MPPDPHTLFNAYLESIGETERRLREKLENAEISLESLRNDFYEFSLKSGFAVANYSIFESDDFEYLRKVVLSVPDAIDYEEYWNRSSAGIAELIIRELGIDASSKVLDFGCGVGRVARTLIKQALCPVVGVDISKSMLQAAERYVASSNFHPIPSAAFHAAPQEAGPFTAAYALIVLQHCAHPEAELKAIRAACVPGARFLVMNARRRFVPLSTGWNDDGVDIRALVDSLFIIEKEIDTSAIPAMRFDPNAPPTAAESDHYTLVARVP